MFQAFVRNHFQALPILWLSTIICTVGFQVLRAHSLAFYGYTRALDSDDSTFRCVLGILLPCILVSSTPWFCRRFSTRISLNVLTFLLGSCRLLLQLDIGLFGTQAISILGASAFLCILPILCGNAVSHGRQDEFVLGILASVYVDALLKVFYSSVDVDEMGGRAFVVVAMLLLLLYTFLRVFLRWHDFQLGGLVSLSAVTFRNSCAFWVGFFSIMFLTINFAEIASYFDAWSFTTLANDVMAPLSVLAAMLCSIITFVLLTPFYFGNLSTMKRLILVASMGSVLLACWYPHTIPGIISPGGVSWTPMSGFGALVLIGPTLVVIQTLLTPRDWSVSTALASMNASELATALGGCRFGKAHHSVAAGFLVFHVWMTANIFSQQRVVSSVMLTVEPVVVSIAVIACVAYALLVHGGSQSKDDSYTLLKPLGGAGMMPTAAVGTGAGHSTGSTHANGDSSYVSHVYRYRLICIVMFALLLSYVAFVLMKDVSTTPRTTVPRFPLKVGTFNVNDGIAEDGQLKLHDLVSTIVRSNADVVALQDCVRGWLSVGSVDLLYVLSKRTEYKYSFFHPLNDAAGGTAIISKFPITLHRFSLFGDNSDSGFMAADIAVQDDSHQQHRVRIFATKLYSSMSTRSDASSRSSAVRLDEIRKIGYAVNTSVVHDIIVAGDMGSDASTPQHCPEWTEYTSKYGMSDAWLASHESPPPEHGATYGTARRDWLLFKGRLSASNATVDFASRASTHKMVVATVSLQ